MSAENCQICGQTKDVSVAGHCQGHTEATEGPWAAPTKPSSAGLSLKEQLDAIPTPSKAAPPGSGQIAGSSSPRATGQNMLPGAGGAMGGPGAGPRTSTTRAPQMDTYTTQDQAAQAGAQPAPPTGDVPQWMRNFKNYQSSIMSTDNEPGTQSSAGYGGSAPSVTPSYNSGGSNFEPPAQSSTYTVMIAIVIIICLLMFVYMMINKQPATTLTPQASPTAPSTSTPGVTTPGINPTTLPGTSQPGTSIPGAAQQNSQMPGSNYPNTYPGAGGQNPATQAGYPPAISPNPVPGQPTGYPPSISPNPVPGALTPNPTPGTVDPNAVAPNPVPGTSTP